MSARLTRIALWTIGVLVTVTFLAQFLVPDVEVTISEDQVRDKLAEHIPYQTEVWPAQIVVQRLGVDFQGGDGVSLDAEIDVDGFGMQAIGTAETLTRLRYDRGAFYLSDLRLDDLTLTPSAETEDRLAGLKRSVKNILDRREAAQPTEADRRQFQEMRATLGPRIRDALDQRLGTIPVYRLQGGPAQWAALLVLKDVQFSRSEAILVLSPAQALLKISLGLLSLLIAVLLAVWWGRQQHN